MQLAIKHGRVVAIILLSREDMMSGQLLGRKQSLYQRKHVTLHFFCWIKHVFHHGVDGSIIHDLMLIQLKRACDQRDDDELHCMR